MLREVRMVDAVPSAENAAELIRRFQEGFAAHKG